MTVIAAKKEDVGIFISSDSQVTRGYHSRNKGYPNKLIEGDDFIIGVCGAAVLITLLSMYSKNRKIGKANTERVTEWCFEFLEYSKNKTDRWNQEGNLIIACRDGLFMIEDWIPIEVEDFCAIGSGYQHAETALYLGETTEKAVEVAVNMAYGCGGDVKTLYIEGRA